MNTITRWNNLAKRFDVISIDAIDERVHDVGNAHPTRFMKRYEAVALESVEAAKVKK